MPLKKKNTQRIIFKFVLASLLFFTSINLTQAASPLVDSTWLNENLNKPNIRFLDLQHPQGYQKAHLPGAVNTRYDQWRQTSQNGVPQVIPEKDYLEELVGQLGIDNNTLVVLTPLGAGASEIAVATRIYWTLKAIGHDEISILDGGLIAYNKTPESRFVKEPYLPEPKQFTANMRKEYYPGAKDVKAALDEGVTIIDSRSYEEYIGKVSGGKNERPGTLPDSLLLSFNQLVETNTGRFHKLDKLREIYKTSGVPLEGKQISFCHTGHRTSLSWFVSHELLGNKEARMYDGSTIEWSVNPDLPLEVLHKE